MRREGQQAAIGESTARASWLSPSMTRLRRTTAADVAFWGLVLGAAALSLALRARAPMWLRSDFILDYGLFGQLAGSLADGQWLGAFDAHNLAKGPSYSIFIFWSYWAHIPLMIAEQLLYLFAAAVMGTALGRLGHSQWLGGVMFAALALNPIHFGAEGSALIREVFYTSVSILLIGSVLLLVSFVPVLARTKYGLGMRRWSSAADSPDSSRRPTTCAVRNAWIAPAVLVAAVAAGIWRLADAHLAVGPVFGPASPSSSWRPDFRATYA